MATFTLNVAGTALSETARSKLQACPICNHTLKITSETYSVDALFDLWNPIMRFSDAVIEQHRQQSEGTTLYRCPNCGLGIFLPQIVGTPAFYQELGAGVEAVYEIQDRWEFDEAIQDVKRSADCRSIIEIGSGGGVFLERATTITDAFGIEYNPDAVAHLRTKGLSVYGIDEQEKLAARKGQFDAVFSFQVLEHVPDPVAFVQSCKDWVRPGGKIGVCVPNSAGFLRHFHNDFFNLPPHHTTLWSAHTLTALAECLNLQVERVAYQPLYHYHYSLLLTWWKDVMRGESFVKRHVRYRGAQLLSQLLQILPKLGIKRLPLRGHSVYILLRLPETR